ncbi:MAG: PDZ domain-containing protein, partial [Ignavibacteria bacterium]
DGVIGKSLFDKYVTEIDLEKSILTFYEPEDFKIDPVEPIPLNLDYGFPVVDTEIGIGLNETIHIKSVVDIGHRSTFLIKEDSLKNILPPCVTIDAIAGRGIQGEVMSKIGRIRELNIGQYSLHNIPASFLDENENMGVPSSIAEGNIGNLVLNRFKLILDYSRKQMFLIKNKNFENHFEINMAGLIIEQDKEGAALIRHVVENSPASEKGILKGDLITSINGKDIREYSFDDLYNLFTKEGDELILNLERNGAKITVTVKLQKLI